MSHHIIKNGQYFALLISIVFFIISINIIYIIWFLNKSFKKKFFFYQGFLLLTLTTHMTIGKGTIFYSTLPLPPAHEHSGIYFATLHVRWRPHTFNPTAWIDQAATRWDLPPYRITIWLIHDVTFDFLFICWFDSRFLLQPLDTEKRWIRSLVLQANRLIKCASHP